MSMLPDVRRAGVAALVLLAASLGCRDSTAAVPDPCNGDITVSVIATTPQPTIGWSPRCAISSLAVTAVAAIPEEEVMWGFTVPEDRPVGPAIMYGRDPHGAHVWTMAKPLSVGKTYRVSVFFTVGGDVTVASGAATFTWFPPD